jgi:ferredoxin
MRVKVDRDLCTGIGNCEAVAPTVFKVDKTNKVVLLDAGSVDDKTLMDAAESCPENAIIIEDDDGNQVYP